MNIESLRKMASEIIGREVASPSSLEEAYRFRSEKGSYRAVGKVDIVCDQDARTAKGTVQLGKETVRINNVCSGSGGEVKSKKFRVTFDGPNEPPPGNLNQSDVKNWLSDEVYVYNRNGNKISLSIGPCTIEGAKITEM